MNSTIRSENKIRFTPNKSAYESKESEEALKAKYLKEMRDWSKNFSEQIRLANKMYVPTATEKSKESETAKFRMEM